MHNNMHRMGDYLHTRLLLRFQYKLSIIAILLYI